MMDGNVPYPLNKVKKKNHLNFKGLYINFYMFFNLLV